MNPAPKNPSEEIEQAAAEWVIRLDRGLDAREQDEYSHWLAVDPRHGEAVGRLRWGWDELDRLAGIETAALGAPDPGLLAPPRRGYRRPWLWLAPAALVAAAAITVVAYLRHGAALGPSVSITAPVAAASPCEHRVLPDGSVVDLNRGAAIDIAFTANVRTVRLLRGEANFTVSKNPARPFIVEAAGVAVRAVGTVFNVHMDPSSVEVVVSEGIVKVHRSTVSDATAPLVHAGQHAVVLLANSAPPPHVADLTAEEIAARLAWQPRMLDFTDAPLRDIVAAFNAHNSVRLVIADPTLETTRLSLTFRSDNVEGFVRLLDANFGMRSEWQNDHEVVLGRK